MQNEMNCAWADVQDRRVEGARPWVKKERHCCSKVERSSVPEVRGVQEWGEVERLGPSAGIPAN